MLHWLMCTVEIKGSGLRGLLSNDMILMGDAAHVQPIMGAAGANDAIVDGLQLAKCLLKQRMGDWTYG
jgi:2-polyprenyl-6-methoxyphenol hydroxylase-like FAD-dependent oxidoreductase